MGLLLDRQFTASFRGIEFLVRREEQTEAGRKTVLHEYPNSDQRYVEDLGAVVPVFSLDAFVSGLNWQQLSLDLETELNTAGVGELVMPNYGSRTVYPLPYTKDATQTAVGIVNFKLTFAIGNPAVAPIQILPDVQTVYFTGDSLRSTLVTVFQALYEAPGLIDNLIVAAQDLQNGLNQMLDDFENIITGQFLEDFADQLRDLGNRAADLVTSPIDFAIAMIQGDDTESGLWQITSVGVGNDGGIDAPLQLTEFGDSLVDTEVSGAAVVTVDGDETSANTPYWPEDTQQRIDRNANRRLFVRMMRLNGLAMAYEQAAAGTYNTTDEIINTRERIEAAYTALMLQGTQDETAIQSANSIKIAMESVRNSALSVLQQKEQELFGLTSIEYNYNIAQFPLAYNLYSEQFTNSATLTERAQIIRGLNPSQNSLAMTGNLSVIEVA